MYPQKQGLSHKTSVLELSYKVILIVCWQQWSELLPQDYSFQINRVVSATSCLTQRAIFSQARNKHAAKPEWEPLENLAILDERMLKNDTSYKDMETGEDGNAWSYYNFITKTTWNPNLA